MNSLLTKRLLLLLCCCTLSAIVFSQSYPKYVVVFKNKNNTPYRFDKPGKYLSQQAIQRRKRYSIPIDSSDLPVNPLYIKQVLTRGPVTYLSQSKWLNQVLIYTTSKTALTGISQLPFVQSINPVGPASTTLQSGIDKFKETTENRKPPKLKSAAAGVNYYDYGNSYNQIHIHNGEFLHNKGLTGKGITIALLDAGFYRYKTTKAFDSARAGQQILGEKDFVDFDGTVNEDNDHGELCLSAIASNIPGVMVGSAPGANFWLLRSENVNTEFPIEEHNWAAAAEFADSAGADMISSSLGYMQFDDPEFNHDYDEFYKNVTTVSRAASFAANKGMLVTNSAGNEGGNSWKYLLFPSDDDSVCAVAATDVNGNIAYFSSYGYPGKQKPNIASVGSGTALYAYYGASYGSGTSFSNPNINGLIACLWQAFPKFNNIAILTAVYRSADRFQTPDNRYGYGLPNMQKAYTILRKAQNLELYGNEWLIVNNISFSTDVSFKLIGRIDGKATISLLDANKKAVAKLDINTEAEEVYDEIINNLAHLPGGDYSLEYTDGTTTGSVKLNKPSAPVAKLQTSKSLLPVK